MLTFPRLHYEGLIKDVATSRKDSVSPSTVSNIAVVSGICLLVGVLMPGYSILTARVTTMLIRHAIEDRVPIWLRRVDVCREVVPEYA